VIRIYIHTYIHGTHTGPERHAVDVGLCTHTHIYTYTHTQDLKDMLWTSGLGISQQDVIRFFEFVPHGVYKQRAKPIEELIDQFQSMDPSQGSPHILLTLPDSSGKPGTGDAYADIADAGGRFLVDLSKVGTVRTEGLQYHALHMASAASVATRQGQAIAFRRFAVLLPPSLPIDVDLSRLGLANGGGIGGGGSRNRGFCESAEIVAEVLSLVAIDQPQHSLINEEEKHRIIRTELETNPLLLYYTSIEFLCSFDNRISDRPSICFANIIADYWQHKLTKTASFRQLTTEEQESRRVVEVLLTSGAPGSTKDYLSDVNGVKQAASAQDASRGSKSKSQSGAQPGAHMLATCEKRIAIASEAHLKILPDIIKRETHFAQTQIVVEETNFESTLQKLKKASPTSVTFFFLNIAGKMSAQQLEQLLSTSSQVVKFIIRSSRSLLTLLELTSHNHSVYRPDSINSIITGSMRMVPYSDGTCVGAMVLHTSQRLHSEPELLGTEGELWDGVLVEKNVEERVMWTQTVKEWACHYVDPEEEFADKFIREFSACMYVCMYICMHTRDIVGVSLC
jgi:hypothetical protein